MLLQFVPSKRTWDGDTNAMYSTYTFNFQLYILSSTELYGRSQMKDDLYKGWRSSLDNLTPDQTEERKCCCQVAKPTTFGTSSDRAGQWPWANEQLALFAVAPAAS